MGKAILLGIILVLMLVLLPACGARVSWEEYDMAVSDLATAQAQVQSLQDDLTAAQTQIRSLQGDLAKAQAQIRSLRGGKTAEEKRAEALAYAEYLDIVLYPNWKEAKLPPRFAFEDDAKWLTELQTRASDIGDAMLSSYLEELEKHREAAAERLWHYCLGRIEKVLK